VAIAMAVTATVLLGLLGLLVGAVGSQAQARDDTVAVQIAGQVVEALRGYELGRDDGPGAQAGRGSLLDELPPFDIRRFPAAGGRLVLGFDAQGARRGSDLAEAFEKGTDADGVAYLVALAGRPAPGRPGLTEITVAVGSPADVPSTNRRNKEFRLLLRPRVAAGRDTREEPEVAAPEAGPGGGDGGGGAGDNGVEGGGGS
jgi:hypothetical protein